MACPELSGIGAETVVSKMSQATGPLRPHAFGTRTSSKKVEVLRSACIPVLTSNFPWETPGHGSGT